MSAMDADITAMMDIIGERVDGPMRQALGLCGINTAIQLLQAHEPIVTNLFYNDNGTATKLHRRDKGPITNLRNFLLDRWVKKLPIDSSSFVRLEFLNFVCDPGYNRTSFAPPLPTSVANAAKVHADVMPDGYFSTAVTDDECKKVHNIALDPADETTSDPVESTHLVSNATTTENATSVVENGLIIDTSRYGSPALLDVRQQRRKTPTYRKT